MQENLILFSFGRCKQNQRGYCAWRTSSMYIIRKGKCESFERCKKLGELSQMVGGETPEVGLGTVEMLKSMGWSFSMINDLDTFAKLTPSFKAGNIRKNPKTMFIFQLISQTLIEKSTYIAFATRGTDLRSHGKQLCTLWLRRIMRGKTDKAPGWCAAPRSTGTKERSLDIQSANCIHNTKYKIHFKPM